VIPVRIVDAHHHLYDLDHIYYPWLSDRVRKVVFGEYAAIRKSYLVKDFLADASAVDLVKSVHIQADCEPHNTLLETEWLQGVADAPGSRGFPHAIIAFADLSSSDAPAVLASLAKFRNVRGIRQMLHHARMSDPTVASVEYMSHPTWLENLDLLPGSNLSFDLHLLPEQMEMASRVVEAHPNVSFILCHAGSPVRREPQDIEQWREGLKGLASHLNVSVKISGLGMYDRKWTVDSIRPFVTDVIDAFGVHRCMFASNFPVDSLMSSYTALWDAFKEITKDLSVADREQLFARNAERIYRI
jgi:predicted TIM-barrel fold metal-dependent hydrolase